MTIWVLSCDASSARILSATRKPDEAWAVLETIDNPAGRLRTSELVSDQPGRVQQSDSGARPAMEAPTDPADKEEERFARELADHLQRARHEGRFDQLVVSAPPRFLGRLRGHLHATVAGAVLAEVQRDYENASPAEVEKRLRPVLDEHR